MYFILVGEAVEDPLHAVEAGRLRLLGKVRGEGLREELLRDVTSVTAWPNRSGPAPPARSTPDPRLRQSEVEDEQVSQGRGGFRIPLRRGGFERHCPGVVIC
jgi:hypothetical protein